MQSEASGDFVPAQWNGRRVQCRAGPRIACSRTLFPRQREMDLVRTRGSEIVQSKGGIVGGYGASWSELEPRGDDVLVWIGGHADEPVEAATDTLEVPGTDVMRQAAGAVAEGTRLRGREVACLGSRKLKQPLQLVCSGGSLRLPCP